MPFRILLVATALFAATARIALAEPQAFYNPASGNVVISNDMTFGLDVASIWSEAGLLTSASEMLDIPGAGKDDSEFPDAYHYFFSVPFGVWNTGNTVTAGTPITDLTFRYRPRMWEAATLVGSVTLIPEPHLLPVVAAGALGLALVNIRFSRSNP